MSTNLLEEAKELLKNNNLASLATASSIDASPEVAIMHYWYDGIRSLYFATLPDSLKMQNLETNSRVALATVNIVNKQELQIEGNAHVVDNPDERTTLLIYIHKAVNKDSSTSTVWPILELHPEDLIIVKVDIEHFKYSSFTKNPTVLKGTFSDWI